MIDWGGGRLGSSLARLSCRLRKAATDERLFMSFGRAAKGKREGLDERVGVGAAWGSGVCIVMPGDEAGCDEWRGS